MNKRTNKSRKCRTDSFGTLSEFAKAAHAPISTLSGWTKHEDWRWNRKAPWSLSILPAVLKWALALERGRPSRAADDDADILAVTDAGDSQTMREAKLDVLRERARKLRQENDQAAGRLLDKETVEQNDIAKIIAVKDAMRQMVWSLADKLEGVINRQEREQVIRMECAAVCNAFANGGK